MKTMMTITMRDDDVGDVYDEDGDLHDDYRGGGCFLVKLGFGFALLFACGDVF